MPISQRKIFCAIGFSVDFFGADVLVYCHRILNDGVMFSLESTENKSVQTDDTHNTECVQCEKQWKSRMRRLVFAVAMMAVCLIVMLCGVITLLVTDDDTVPASADTQNSSETVTIPPEVTASPETTTTNQSSEADSESKVHFWDNQVGYSWLPQLSGADKHSYNLDNMKVDEQTGRITYIEDGKTASTLGIDVSEYQGDIDWAKVKADGVEFAIMRVGYRGYGKEGKIRKDARFEEYYKGAKAQNIQLGVYFFSQATTEEEAIVEADFVIKELNGRSLDLPVAFDWENISSAGSEGARTDEVRADTVTKCAVAFCERIKQAGYKPMVYTNRKLAIIKYDLRELNDYPKWVANYYEYLDYCYEFSIWQYGQKTVNGIKDEVDVNVGMWLNGYKE